MNYRELKARQQDEVKAFPTMVAFDKEQFAEGMKKLGLSPDDKDKVCGLFGGVFIRKSDIGAWNNLCERHEAELQAAINADKTGNGFMFDMFNTELSNHEYGYTGDETDAIEALGLSWEDIEQSDKLRHGLHKATKKQRDWYEKSA